MVRWSRRRALRAAAATVSTAVLAGCVDDSEPTRGQRRDRGEPVTDYETTTVREEDVFPPFWLEAYDDPADRPSRPVGDALVAEPLADAAITFDTDADPGAALRSFVAATEFDRECVYLYSTTVRGCQTVELSGVRRRSESVGVSLCQRLRQPDVACERDAEHTLGLAARLPFPGDEVNARAVTGGGHCDHESEPLSRIGGDGE